MPPLPVCPACGWKTGWNEIKKNRTNNMTHQNTILNAPSPAAQKLELLRQLFPQAVEVDADGRVRVNAAAMQQALDPANPAGVRVEEDGFELRWVGKREAFHNAFVPAQKIVQPAPEQSKNWDNTGNLLIKGDNIDALRLLRHSYFGKLLPAPGRPSSGTVFGSGDQGI